MNVPVVRWHGCYDSGWNGLIVAEAFAHPAKMARGLVARIFDELFALGALERGDTVCDPFGGIGTTAIEGASRGVQVVCCELEPKFVALAQQNFELHRRDWEAMGRPQPRIVQGDSRRLREHVGPVLAECVLSSPPYAESLTPGNRNDSHEHRQDLATRAGHGKLGGGQLAHGARYSFTPENIGNLPAGEVDAVVSSPPFTQGYAGGGGINKTGYGPDGADKVGARTYQGTGAERVEGNLETLALGEVDAVVSSPPCEKNVEGHMRADKWKSSADFLSAGRGHGCSDEARLAQLERDKGKTYGDSDGQLWQQQGETFWTAAAQIVAEAFAILKPGGVAVWVVKAFVRNKQIVDFPGDWRKLCEHAGFVTVREVHAMLVAETTHNDLFDGERTTKRERKSFFRRLAEKKGSPAIDFETVLFMVKPRT